MECQYTSLLQSHTTEHSQFYGSVLNTQQESESIEIDDVLISIDLSSDLTENIQGAVTPVFSKKYIWNPTIQPKSDHLKFIFNILRGHLPTLSEVREMSTLVHNVLYEADPKLFAEVRVLIQDLLIDMHEQLSTQALSDSDHFHMEMIIGDILSLLPFLRPVHNDTIQVPIKTKAGWELITYTIDRIEMTPAWMGSQLVAYGLHSDFDQAPPLLLFKGTTYPSDEGAWLSFLTDLNPFASVGSYAFSIGREKIQTWLEIHASSANAIIYGKSLGGALAWRSAINFPEKIAKVMAYGAPGFFPWEKDKVHQVTDEYPHLRDRIYFFCQENDLVPYSDWAADRGVIYYKVLTTINHENPLIAHADMYSTHENSEIQIMEQKDIQNPWKRAAVTAARLFASILFPVILIGHIIKTSIDHLYTCCLHIGEWCQKENFAEEISII